MLSEPLPYHLKIRDHFKKRSGVWSFFSATRKKEEHTFPLLSDSDPLLYEKITIIRERLGLPPEEAQVVFNDPSLPLLNEQELSAHIAHELARIKFNTLLGGELETTDRIITAMAGSPASSATHYETARLFRLYKEIYCDRVACAVLGEMGPVITMLSKVAKGLAPGQVETRTTALRLWNEREGKAREGREGMETSAGREPSLEMETPAGMEPSAEMKPSLEMNKSAEAAITQMIEGVLEVDRLDVLMQDVLYGMTRGILNYYLQPEWIRTPVVLGLARQYFSDLGAWGPDETDAIFPDRLKIFLTGVHSSIREYFAYVLLDLALADPDLKDQSLGHARELAETLGLTPVLEPIIKKETTYSNDAH